MTPVQANSAATLRDFSNAPRDVSPSADETALPSALSRLARFCMRTLHGSTLLLGIASALLIAGALLHTDDAVSKLQELSLRLQPVAAESEETVTPGEDALAPQGVRLQAAIDYVARRYRVAAPAVSPILRTVESSAREAGLDPLLIVAVIGIESGFNPLSESAMGARGLMQVIGRYHPEKVDLAADPEALLDPHTNVRVGVQVLREYIRRGKRLENALQAYAGAADDADMAYARRVIAEKTRLEEYVRRATATRTAEGTRTPQT